jgi:class 3 adenylate cyclase
VASQIVRSLLARKAPDVNVGRVLPSIDDLAVGEGRKLNAAFVYTDLHGFTKLVASLPTTTSFSLMQAFVELMWRITRHFGGTLVDCAGDRVLSVFDRPALDFSPEPVREAITAALWSQVIVQRAIAPEFARKGVPDTSVAIGVDYGPATIGCVGIRTNKRLVFFGDAANLAAKLQDNAGPNDTALSPAAYARRPAYMDDWIVYHERDADNNERHRVDLSFKADEPPPRALYLK